jgi:hypothetical protein
MTIDTALNQGLVVRGKSLESIYSETTDGTDQTPLVWTPEPDHPLHDWLTDGNRFWAVSAGQVRLTILGHEAVKVPMDLLEAIKVDGESRVWEQGGYTFSVAMHEGQIKTGLIGMPEDGNAVEAWTQEVTRVGLGATFDAAAKDAFDTSFDAS